MSNLLFDKFDYFINKVIKKGDWVNCKTKTGMREITAFSLMSEINLGTLGICLKLVTELEVIWQKQ